MIVENIFVICFCKLWALWINKTDYFAEFIPLTMRSINEYLNAKEPTCEEPFCDEPHAGHHHKTLNEYINQEQLWLDDYLSEIQNLFQILPGVPSG